MRSRYAFLKQPALLALIALNCLVYIILLIVSKTGRSDMVDVLTLSPSVAELATRPWTVVSYAFVQTGLFQLPFNMLWLYSFGTLLLLHVQSRDFLIVYLSGAIAGAIAFLSASSLLDDNTNGHLIGSSAAVIAVAVAVSVIIPDTKLNLPLFGQTKIKWIVGFLFLLFCIGLSTPNAGGNLAHIGGAFAGLLAGLIIVRSKRSTPYTNEELRRLTEKIRISGYNALTADEKRRFFELSATRK